MATPGKWLKSLINPKKPTSNNDQEMKGNWKNWRLWRSSSDGFAQPIKGGVEKKKKKGEVASSDANVIEHELAAAMATLLRAQPKDFRVVKREWAALRIQTVFRGFLARRALRALRASVRLQAIFRGRRVRKQAAVTLRCMQALLRVQTRIRAPKSSESDERRSQAGVDDHVKQAEQGWCESPGSVNEARAKLQMRHRANLKRDRAIAYSLSQQKPRSCSSLYSRSNTAKVAKKLADNSSELNWLENWMANKPWENRVMEEGQLEPSEKNPYNSRRSGESGDDIYCFYPFSSPKNYVKVRRNNVTTRISPRPSQSTSPITRSSSSPSSDYLKDGSSSSTSFTSASPIGLSTNPAKVEESNTRKPSYMNPTESIKAKNRNSDGQNMQKYFMEEYRFHSKSFSNGDTRSMNRFHSKSLSNGDTRSMNGSSDFSGNFCNDQYPPVSQVKAERARF